MEKEFVPYQIALELKELGFDEPCFGYFLDGKLNFYHNTSVNDRTNSRAKYFISNIITAVTYYQAFSWIKKKYKLHSWVTSKTIDGKSTVYIPHGRTIPDTIKKGLVVDIVPYVTFKTEEEADLERLKILLELCQKKE